MGSQRPGLHRVFLLVLILSLDLSKSASLKTKLIVRPVVPVFDLGAVLGSREDAGGSGCCPPPPLNIFRTVIS